MKQKNFKKITDSYGYLIKFNYWNEDIAKKIALIENINLKNIHWKLIYFLRRFYKKFNSSPGIIIMIKFLKKEYKNKKIDSRYLIYLFPKDPVKQSIKIAGLPKPIQCI